MTDPIAAIEAAEAAALAAHEAGACSESEWSCSHCEAEEQPSLGDLIVDAINTARAHGLAIAAAVMVDDDGGALARAEERCVVAQSAVWTRLAETNPPSSPDWFAAARKGPRGAGL